MITFRCFAFGPAQSQWQRTIVAFADRLGQIEATVIATAIRAASTELWADPARHKYRRHRVGDARRRIVATAFAALAAGGHPAPPKAVGDALADAYNALHDEELSMFPGAHETLDRLKGLGVKLAPPHLRRAAGRYIRVDSSRPIITPRTAGVGATRGI